MNKREAKEIHGGLTTTTKLDGIKSYSTPVLACVTGHRMAAVPGSVCSECYAARGRYLMHRDVIEPVQHARYEAMLYDPHWVDAMVASLYGETYFRWFDAGDIPSVDALLRIVSVCWRTPWVKHWLPTREYGMVKTYVEKYGGFPENLVVRLSAMYPDRAAVIPVSLQDVPGVLVGNVHHLSKPVGKACEARDHGNQCSGCRACWDRSVAVVSYPKH